MSTARSTARADFVQTNVVGTYHPARSRARLLRRRCRRRGGRHSASTMSPPTRCSARSGPATRRSPKPRRTIRAARIPPARRPPTIWCAPGTTPTGCRRIVSNTTNNYGPWQFPEKLIPLVHAERAGGQAAAGLRRRLQHARLAVRRGPRRGAGASARTRRARRDLRHRRRASRAPTCRWCARSAPPSTPACPTRPARASG